MRVSSVLLNFVKLVLHSHLLCELFRKVPDLCEVEGCSVFRLPVFQLVKIIRLLFSCSKQAIFKIGKTVWGVGKMVFPYFFFSLFKLNSSSANSIRR